MFSVILSTEHFVSYNGDRILQFMYAQQKYDKLIQVLERVEHVKLMRGKQVEEMEDIDPRSLIGETEVESIRQDLINEWADLVVQGMLDKDVREQLRAIVARDYKTQTKGNPSVVDHIVRETIGTGVVEEILQDPNITDLGYNGSELIIESNDSKLIFDTDFAITDEYIVRLVGKFANANNKDFTSKTPIFDGRFDNVRINAVHAQNTAPESGTTMSLRVVRPRLALTKDNFNGFAPMFVADLLEAFAKAKANMVISGTTGTGKTELHKFISGYIPFQDRIILIEDTPETFMKEMFPEKDIYSWVTSENVTVTQLIKAGLRNHPVWMMVTETRGAEAYEMIQTVLSGHSIITSLHATNARAIPSRFVNMAKMGYQLDESALLDDIRRYFDFGLHIKKIRHNGRVIRYLAEILAFDPEGDKTVFKQRFVNDVFEYETFDLPQSLLDTMEELSITVNFPANIKASHSPTLDGATFETVIPIDETGRPDFKKIEEMGTTLDILMGREKEAFDPSKVEHMDFGESTDGFIGTGSAVNPFEDAKRRAATTTEDEPVKKAAPRRPARPTQAPEKKKLDPTFDRLVSGLKQTDAAKASIAPKRPAQAKPEKSVEQLLAEKRARLRREDV